MSRITIDNCEAFFLDYHEGNLGVEDTAALFAFLEENPEYKGVFEDFAPIVIRNEVFDFPEKELLKKAIPGEVPVIHEGNCSFYFIAAHEGDLTSEALEAVQTFLKHHPERVVEYEAYRLARLTPEVLVFPDKKNIRQGIPVVRRLRPYWMTALSAAAALALLWMFLPQNSPVEIPIANPPVQSSVSGNADHPAATGLTARTGLPSQKPLEVPPKNEVAPVPEPTAVRIESLPGMMSIAVNEIAIPPSGRSVESINRVHTAVYADIMLRWQLEASGTEPGLLARLFRPVTGWFSSGDEEETLPVRNPLTLWTLAEYGVKGFSRITNHDVELRHSKDEQGRLVAFSLESENFKIARVKPAQNSGK